MWKFLSLFLQMCVDCPEYFDLIHERLPLLKYRDSVVVFSSPWMHLSMSCELHEGYGRDIITIEALVNTSSVAARILHGIFTCPFIAYVTDTQYNRLTSAVNPSLGEYTHQVLVSFRENSGTIAIR